MVPNSRIPQLPQEPKRFQRMSEDIRNFTLRQSMPSISSSVGTAPQPQSSFSNVLGAPPLPFFIGHEINFV